MEKNVYVVGTVFVETKNGKNAERTWLNETNQEFRSFETFEDFDEAMNYYNSLEISCSYEPYHRIYEHVGKELRIEIHELIDDEWEFAYEEGSYIDFEEIEE